jgi:hypothetical protein
MIRIGLAISIALLAAGGATSQAPVGKPACSGAYGIIRTSTILPGKMATVEKAAADQKAWYAAHHDGTKTYLLKVVHRSASGETLATDEVMTMTIHPHDEPMPKRDAAWDAFVAEYKASSTIKSETTVCMPPM